MARARATSGLDRESIAGAALRVVDRDGSTGFSIRAVAAELGASPMALYYHVADRTDLVVAMVEAAYSEHSLDDLFASRPSATGTKAWSEELWLIAQWYFATTVRHPHLHAVAQDVGPTPTLVDAGERWFAIWRRSGLDDAIARDAAHASVATMTALVRSAALSAPLYELAVRSLVEGLYERLS